MSQLWHTSFVATISIDTGVALNRLTDAGIDRKEAEAIVETIRDVDLQQVSSKDDIHRLELKLTELEARILRWAVPLLVGQAAVFAAIVKWL